MNVVKQYAEWFKRDQWIKDITPNELSKIQKGEAIVVKHGKNTLAIYKDKKEKLHCFSAVCTHLKCIVHWNAVEKTFDCPCHGSRYTCFGKVVNGPASYELEKKNVAIKNNKVVIMEGKKYMQRSSGRNGRDEDEYVEFRENAEYRVFEDKIHSNLEEIRTELEQLEGEALEDEAEEHKTFLQNISDQINSIEERLVLLNEVSKDEFNDLKKEIEIDITRTKTTLRQMIH